MSYPKVVATGDIVIEHMARCGRASSGKWSSYGVLLSCVQSYNTTGMLDARRLCPCSCNSDTDLRSSLPIPLKSPSLVQLTMFPTSPEFTACTASRISADMPSCVT